LDWEVGVPIGANCCALGWGAWGTTYIFFNKNNEAYYIVEQFTLKKKNNMAS
jgi:hypothetical protein